MKTDFVEVTILDEAGDFAGNKEAARKLRDTGIRPALEQGKQVRINFSGVKGATQSFVHALISGSIRDKPENLDRIVFSGCNEMVRSIVEMVVEYSQYQQVLAEAPDDQGALQSPREASTTT